jgi:hypothetical protein
VDWSAIDLSSTPVSDAQLKGIAILRAAKPNVRVYSGPWESAVGSLPKQLGSQS